MYFVGLDPIIAAPLIALPWLAWPLVTVARAGHSRSLDEERADTPPDPPLISVIIPARNEARNIADCVRSVLQSSYPKLELIVVNDHSTDATRDIVSSIARADARVTLLDNPDLLPGWFGKQWACQTGAAAARGTVLCFVDADTRHTPELLSRAINGMQRTGSELYSVAGRQKLGSFWERLVQPQIFTLLASRYGSTETVNRSLHAHDKIVNGQFIMVLRRSYDALGGHSLVRTFVAEDLMLAKRYFQAGRKVTLVLGTRHLSTRMYSSLGEIVAGWGKNVFAGGREAVPFGAAGRLIFPVLLLSVPLFELAPVLALVAGALGLLSGTWFLAGIIATAALLALWTIIYRSASERAAYALLFPLGAAVMLYIFASAIMHGSRVTWKGRAYTSG